MSTTDYDSHILPLICQMTCLEELALHLVVQERSTFIDGTHLRDKMLIHLVQLRIFNFNIATHTESMSDEMHMQSNHDICRTFLNWKYGSVTCYISHYPNNCAHSHIFSLPLSTIYISSITYGFTEGLYTNIRHLYLSDTICPFKHEFFLRIARSFPLLTHLTVFNSRFLDDLEEMNNQKKPLVEFHSLIRLTIHFQRVVYVEQFLVDTNTYLPNLIDLTVSYNNLVAVTENFTRHETRRNCSKVQTLAFTIPTATAHSQEFFSYFPCLKSIL